MISRKLVFAAVAMVAVLGLVASIGLADCGKCGEKPKVTCLAGAVKSVDAKAQTIVLTTGKGEEAKDVTLKVCPKAKITIDGKDAKLADVNAGAAARVCHIKNKKGDLVAVRLVVGAAGCPKESK